MANDSYQLVVRNAPQSGLAPGQVIALEDDVLTLGRDPLSDIILDDPEVSRHHARLALLAGGYAIQDMGSTNGTFVDGKRLTGDPITLKPGQVIMLGSNVTLVYQAIAAVDPLATVVAPVAVAEPALPEEPELVEEPEEIIEEKAEVVEEPAAEVEEAVPAVKPVEVEAEEFEEPEVIAEEIIEVDEEEDFATIMDESPFAAPVSEPAPESEPFPEITPEPEPLPEIPAEPEPYVEEPAFEIEPPAAPELPAATFDEFEERTYIDSAAPVPDFDETPLEPMAAEVPPAPPTPPLPEFDEPKGKASSNRNLIIIAVVVVL
ncbi:MAG: FHA domain-containing protein, partial [Chloroflexota bacterium]